MIKSLNIFAFMCVMMLVGCSDGQKTFYWYRPETGVNYFAKDHAACLYESDSWVYEVPNWGIPPRPETYDLRLRSEAEDGIWAFYVPLPGSQPLYVNSRTQGQWSMDPGEYASCMRNKGYEDMYKPIESTKIGVKYCSMKGCVNPEEYNAINSRNGQYHQIYNRSYYGNGPYTSHYYGYDSHNFYK